MALTAADVAFTAQGLVVTVRRSKTDPEGVGRTIGIPPAQGPVCPVRALRAWLATAAGLVAAAEPPTPAPLFRPIDRHGRLALRALTGHAGVDPTVTLVANSFSLLVTGTLTAAA